MFGNGFSPGASGSIAVTAASENAQATGQGKTLYVNNVGSTECFVALGGSTVTATTSSMSFPPGFACALAMDSNTYIAAITASGTTTLRFTRGDGQ